MFLELQIITFAVMRIKHYAVFEKFWREFGIMSFSVDREVRQKLNFFQKQLISRSFWKSLNETISE